MVMLYLDNAEVTTEGELLALVQSAIQHEIQRLEIALEVANKRLQPFEQKYGVTSEYFISTMAAEDLEGRDDEYISWAGEYKLKERLVLKLQRLQKIKYYNGHLPYAA